MERRDSSQEEDAEDISLCDLPLLSLVKDDQAEIEKQRSDDNDDENDGDKEVANENAVLLEADQEEFAFGSLTGGSLSAPCEMCSADEVFFRGQILPLRLSVSSDYAGLNRADPARNSRSESMDHGSLAGLRSISSRSSSCSSRSTQNSSSITSRTLITITRVASEPRNQTRNQFSTHPSPKPQIRVSGARGLERASSAGRRQKSSMWDLFRLGLVRTPDIELQEIKANLRGNKYTNYSITRSSSVNHGVNNINLSSNGGANSSTGGENSNNVAEKQKRRKFLSGCRCSAETVDSNVVVVKSKGIINYGTNHNMNGISGAYNHGGVKEKVPLKLGDKTTSLKMMKKNIVIRQGSSSNDDDDHDDYQKRKQEGSRKQAMSHHRTCEWLKELSHANLPMHV